MYSALNIERHAMYQYGAENISVDVTRKGKASVEVWQSLLGSKVIVALIRQDCTNMIDADRHDESSSNNHTRRKSASLSECRHHNSLKCRGNVRFVPLMQLLRIDGQITGTLVNRSNVL